MASSAILDKDRVSKVCNKKEEKLIFYKAQLEQIRDELITKKNELEEELSASVPGQLYCVTKDGRNYYFQRIPRKGNRKKEKRIGITCDEEIIMKLLRKGYLKSALKTITSEGYSVRSKSEMIIMGRPIHFNIPFRYEFPLELENGDGMGGTEKLIPDFTIMRPIDNKAFYWEHFGLMEDDSYIKRFRHKRWLYEYNGITEWENFIITFDEQGGGINQMLVDAKIIGKLL